MKILNKMFYITSGLMFVLTCVGWYLGASEHPITLLMWIGIAVIQAYRADIGER